MVKRKATVILESLKEEPEIKEDCKPEQPIEKCIDKPVELKKEPVKRKPEVDVDQLIQTKLAKKSKDDLIQFQKKLEDRENRLEMRLENMIQRKFMEVKNLAKPVYHYKPKQPPPIQRMQVRQPVYEPEPEEEEDWSGYATQEEYEEPAPVAPLKSDLYQKIFG